MFKRTKARIEDKLKRRLKKSLSIYLHAKVDKLFDRYCSSKNEAKLCDALRNYIHRLIFKILKTRKT